VLVFVCPGNGAPAPPYLASNHNCVLQLLMIRKSAVWVGKLLGEGVGATTGEAVVTGVAAAVVVVGVPLLTTAAIPPK